MEAKTDLNEIKERYCRSREKYHGLSDVQLTNAFCNSDGYSVEYHALNDELVSRGLKRAGETDYSLIWKWFESREIQQLSDSAKYSAVKKFLSTCKKRELRMIYEHATANYKTFDLSNPYYKATVEEYEARGLRAPLSIMDKV